MRLWGADVGCSDLPHNQACIFLFASRTPGPPGTQEGSAEVVGIEADNQNILVALDAGVYNVRKATCNGSCQSCNGATSWSISADPFAVGLGGQLQEVFYAQYCAGTVYNETGSSIWGSSNTSVATVQAGLVQGVNPSPSPVTVAAGDSGGPICAQQCNPYAGCPAYTGGGASAPGNVIDQTPVITGIDPSIVSNK
jgi:hypothetical protein